MVSLDMRIDQMASNASPQVEKIKGMLELAPEMASGYGSHVCGYEWYYL